MPRSKSSRATFPRPARGVSCEDACAPISPAVVARCAVTTPQQLGLAGALANAEVGTVTSAAATTAESRSRFIGGPPFLLRPNLYLAFGPGQTRAGSGGEITAVRESPHP